MAMAAPASSRHIPGFSAPSVGFEQPFAMLEACHERVLRTLALLERLQNHVCEKGADESARQAALDVLRYFDIAAPLHHEDEELHVFPPLLAHGTPELQALVQRLQQDHVHMVADWAAARIPLRALARGEIQLFAPEEESLFARFVQRYAAHIQGEEGQAYPAAMGLVEPHAQEQMGREMAHRRGAPGA